MKTLSNFLACLPGVMPRKTRDVVLEGDILTPAERADIHQGDGFWGTLEVGPDAAAAILVAYRAGRLPMKRGAFTGETPEGDAYLAKRDTLLALIGERNRRDAALKDTSLLQEADFSDNRFMDAVFLRHVGSGVGSMTLAGILVTKTLARYPSNSGKSQGWAVTFNWTGSDGRPRSAGSVPPEASNQRNSADRNWGLYE